MNAPDRIWLQDAGDYECAAEFEVTWCSEPQDDGDTEYIRADLVQALIQAAHDIDRQFYDAWFRGKVEEALNSTKTSKPHTEVMQHLRASIGE